MEIQSEIISDVIAPTKVFPHTTMEYSELLDCYGTLYKNVNYHLQVGEILNTQGWILHLSVVISQITNLLKAVVPYLIRNKIPFKIPKNLATAEDLLGGNLGTSQIGKIVSIYPDSDDKANTLVKDLGELTKPFKGPAIPTDFCLKNIVYTRYGSFNPVLKPNIKGENDKYIYDEKGELIPDEYLIPFQFPKKINWPFLDISEQVLPDPPKFSNRLYKILSILKSDSRGNVFYGLYLKSLLQVKKCVLKQGFTNADSDLMGRDIRDKLAWQAELQKELAGSIPMPEQYGFIHEDTYSLLAMQYIKSDSLYNKVHSLNLSCMPWPDLSSDISGRMLEYGLNLTHIISCFHKKGYVHRDIMPVNFLINKKEKMFAIDLELAYSFLNKKPNPPFRLGTPGFASPEQMETLPPTIKQDIYSLGATLLWLFTGLTPIKFRTKDTDLLYKYLKFFTQQSDLALIIASCLSHVPEVRPDILSIANCLVNYRNELHQNKNNRRVPYIVRISDQHLQDTILAGVMGLTKPPVIIFDDLWYSKQTTAENYTAVKSLQYTRYPGIGEGMSGPLYVLSRMNFAGMEISASITQFKKTWEFIDQNYLNNTSALLPGLYYGAAGLILALKEGLNSGLLDRSNPLYTEAIQVGLAAQNDKLDLATGVTGQGIAILQCGPLLTKDTKNQLLGSIIDHILNSQKENGLWHDRIRLNVALGDTGILWFLIDCLSIYSDNKIQKCVELGLNAILNANKNMNSYYKTIGKRGGYEQVDGGSGIILLCLKAYKTFQEAKYKEAAIKALSNYPARVVHTNFCQQNGLAGLGELYLEAWHVLQQEEWKSRSEWITNFFLHVACRSPDGSAYWIMEEQDQPTADLLTGTSGIIHYLVRCLYPDKIGYRLLK